MLAVVDSRQSDAHNRIPAAEVRHDARGDPAFGGWDGGSRSERGGDGSTGTDWSRTGGPVAFRSWRWLTRTGVQLKKKWGVIHSHVEGLLEQGGIKLSAVVSDLFGSAGGPCWNSSGRDGCRGAGGEGARSAAQAGQGVARSLGAPLGAGLPALAATAHGCRNTSRRCILDVRALLDSELPCPA